MDIFLICDLTNSVSTIECSVSKTGKKLPLLAERSLNFAKAFSANLDPSQYNLHLICLVGRFTSHKYCVKHSTEIDKSFSEITAVDVDVHTYDFNKLKELVLNMKSERATEILYVTDAAENFAITDEFVLPFLIRFVIITDYNTEYLDEQLVASLECFSMQCGLKAGMAANVKMLDASLHFPLMIGNYKSEVEMATALAKEDRFYDSATIECSPTLSLSVMLKPGLSRRLSVSQGEILNHKIYPTQSNTMKLAGFLPLAKVAKLPSTSVISRVMRNKNSQQDEYAFNNFCNVLNEKNVVAVLRHSSGEKCLLKSVLTPSSSPKRLMFLQFLSSSYVKLRRPNAPSRVSKISARLSYKAADIFYWNDGPEITADINRLCRRLKKESNAANFYEEVLRLSRFSVACGYADFASKFALLLERRAITQELSLNPHLIRALNMLRSPPGFHTVLMDVPKFLKRR